MVPVLVGTAVAACGYAIQFRHGFGGPSLGGQHRPVVTLHPGLFWWRALGALVVALAIQVGTNYANDYSDGIRGTDDVRVGPVRLVASGLALAVGKVKRAALAAFAVAGVAGLGLAAVTSWWVLAVGAACLAAGWFYTGGPRPYGYAGYGELFVFVFFGVVATVGTFYVESLRLGVPAVWLAAVAVGLLATALLLANNLRDIATDRLSGKRTLAVRIGRQWGGRLLRRLPGARRSPAQWWWQLLAVTGGAIRPRRPWPFCPWWRSPWPWCRSGWPSGGRRAAPCCPSWPTRGACSWPSDSCWRWDCGSEEHGGAISDPTVGPVGRRAPSRRRRDGPG